MAVLHWTTGVVQFSSLEIPKDRGAWRATVHGVAKSRTRLSNKHRAFYRPGSQVGTTKLYLSQCKGT